MEFLRRLRLSRSDADADGNAAAEAMGLDAFGTESAVVTPGAAAPVARPQSHIVMLVLASLVLIEAVPAGLWVRSRLRAPVVTESVAAAGLPAAAAIPLASCESAAPAPAASAPGSAPTSVPTTGAGKPAAAAAHGDGSVPPVAPVDKSMLAGSVAVSAPVPMQVLLRGRVVGTTEAESFMLPVGTHELEFVNQGVGFRTRRTVSVQAGKTSTVRLEPPAGTMHINAVPWAEVWMDGQRIGETPIGNLSATIGTRELVFRHPELGERKASVMVTLKEPARISMDLRKK